MKTRRPAPVVRCLTLVALLLSTFAGFAIARGASAERSSASRLNRGRSIVSTYEAKRRRNRRNGIIVGDAAVQAMPLFGTTNEHRSPAMRP